MTKNSVETKVIGIVTSHKSGGRAKISRYAHNHIVKGFKDASLTSKKFKDFPINTLLVITLKGLPQRRQIVEVQEPIFQTEPRTIKSAIVELQQRFQSQWTIDRENIESVLTQQKAPKTEEGEEIEVSEKVSLPMKDAWVNGGNFFMTKEQQQVFEMAYVLSENHPSKVQLLGDSGYGKTSIAEAYAKEKGMGFYRLNVSQVSDPVEFFGIVRVEDGDTVFKPSNFMKHVMDGNCVIVLDEINRVESWLTNILFPIMDDAAETDVLEVEVKVGKNVIFVLTANIGYQFVGTFEMDTAFQNRIDMTLFVGALPKKVESKLVSKRTDVDAVTSNKIVEITNDLRKVVVNEGLDVDVSTRTTIKIGRLLSTGIIDMKKAFSLVVGNTLSIEERKPIIDAVSDSLT